MTTYPCAQCGAPYEQGSRRATPYCPTCRRERNLANDRRAKRAARMQQTRDSVAVILDDYVRQGMDVDYVELMRAHIDDHIDDVVPHEDVLRAAQPLTGANSPAGPNEGSSTYFSDLADDLAARAAVVAAHPWWSENPNWWVGMHDPDAPIPATAKLKAS